ncbi:MAG: hypothetical protein KME21_11510 [Desmonostoc vinosum HA7617-LM4]|jgi:hypothetical protein|nr:hypothetical protein [Desmonostoc vinosum HA7617-LM4]
MLKPLLLSGWFRARPLFTYAVVMILIAPLFGASSYSSTAKTKVAKTTSTAEESNSVSQEVVAVGEPKTTEMTKAEQVNSLTAQLDSNLKKMPVVEEPQVLQADKIKSLVENNSLSNSNVSVSDQLNGVELAPVVDVPISQFKLVQKLKAARVQSLKRGENIQVRKAVVAKLLATAQVAPNVRISQPSTTTEIPVEQLDEEAQAEQTDPIGSPHPIPWKWITATQEAIGSQGGSGVRYYRSIPVVSPDGKYAVYSRVQLEVKPEMYNSRVTSVLFVQDLQTKKLWVMASTAGDKDPLLETKVVSSEPTDAKGTIGVLVPVSWSEKGDRFLARKFEGIFNTGDATDHAVIWDRQQNRANTVAPAQVENDHEKIAVLLGWSKSQPDHVLFRAGEMGEENWPLVKVSNNGETVNTTTDADQPITFGRELTEVWSGPQVAYR